MNIIFWQNILSPHQLPYIIHLLDNIEIKKVVLLSGEDISIERKQMGWEFFNHDKIGNIEIIINPNNEKIKEIFSLYEEDSWHLFSGIRGFKFVFEAFKESINYKIKRGIITESPNTFAFGLYNGKPLWLHKIRFFIQDKKYARYISKVFAIGDEAISYFKSVYKNWDVIPFTYCTETYNFNNESTSKKNVNFCFVGSLSLRKSPDSIIKAGIIINKEINISFIGGGEKESVLKRLSNKNKKINVTFHGFKKNKEISLLLSNQDVLILPSIRDGWGAVINEAIQSGLFVICSDKCGAKELLRDKRIGRVFRCNDIYELSNIMNFCIDNIDIIRNDREYRKNWAEKRISGKVIAQYMIDCLNNKKAERPWFK